METDNATKAVNMRMPVTLIFQLKREAKRRGMTYSQLIRAVLAKFIDPTSVKL